MTKREIGELLLLLAVVPGLQEKIAGREPTIVTKMWQEVLRC